MRALDLIGGGFMVSGAVLILLAAVGVVRFSDIYARMHAAAKAPALGVLLVAIGSAFTIRSTPATVAALLVVVLQVVTGPVGAHVLGRSIHLRLKPPLDGPDESEGQLNSSAI